MMNYENKTSAAVHYIPPLKIKNKKKTKKKGNESRDDNAKMTLEKKVTLHTLCPPCRM